MTERAIKLADVRVTSQGLRSRLLDPPVNGDERTILDGVSLELQRGEALSVLGESGGGKSTLMRTINRLVEPESGSVEVLGKPANDWNIRQLRSAAIYVPQRAFLFGGSVREELTHAMRWNGVSPINAPFGQALSAVDLLVDQSKDASELSEGQRHRLCIARALMLNPTILILDEPTGSLDVRTARDVLAGVHDWVKERDITLLVITHRPEDLEALGGEALILLNGKVAGRYPGADVIAGRVNEDVGAFFGSSSGGRE